MNDWGFRKAFNVGAGFALGVMFAGLLGFLLWVFVLGGLFMAGES